AAYRAAISNDASLRADPALIQSVIRCLDSDRFHGGCEDFLRREVGAPALPHLNQAAETNTLENVRRRARKLAAQIDRGQR
ncbi:MAG TPA: hypothetical protein VND93_15500, partial [Myxococcales bacterium]|nr:hypothetical protein [Myxococcales bacterium]